QTLGIAELDSVTLPDLAWVKRRRYHHRRPTVVDLSLLIEVADSSLRYDLGEKCELYAKVGVSDYWVVNVPKNSVVVHRRPGKKGYRDVSEHFPEETIHPLAHPQAGLAIAELFALPEDDE